MYDNYLIYGPYDHNRRLRLVMVDKVNGRKTSISYAKYLMEVHLGRYLKSDETVDHIDNDYTNNDISNLRVISRSRHAYEDVLRNKPNKVHCEYCGKVFIGIEVVIDADMVTSVQSNVQVNMATGSRWKNNS